MAFVHLPFIFRSLNLFVASLLFMKGISWANTILVIRIYLLYLKTVLIIMNVVPRSTGNTNSGTRELTLKCKLKCYFKPMNNPLGVSPSKGKQGTTRGMQRKNLLTSVGIEPTTYGLDLPSLCRLSYKVAQRKSGTILDGESRRRESMGTNECCAA